MQQCIKILLFPICMKLNMFRATHVQLVDVVRHSVPDNVHQITVQQPFTYEKLEAASAVLGS
jgi:hypothetical protein